MPEVTELYRSIAAGARARAYDEVLRKLTECFLEIPFADPGAATSMVREGADGRLAGFFGLIPRRWQYNGRLLVGVATTGMVIDPNHPDAKNAAQWLTRSGLGQAYDFSICDKPTDLVTKMRTGRGSARSVSTNVVFRSHIITGHGYRWRIGLRNTEDARQRMRALVRWRRYWPALAPLDRVARRLAQAWDARRPRPVGGKAVDRLALEDATPASLFEARLALAEVYSPCMVDDAPLAKWQYDFLADYPSRGRFRWLIARVNGAPVGWFLYYVRQDQPSEVASVVAVPEFRAAVVAAMLECAHKDGCTGLVGTTSGVMAHELIEAGATIFRCDRLLVAARDPEVLEAFRSSRTMVTGLESEIWI